MDRHALLRLFDREQRIDIEFPDMRKDVLPHVVRFVRPAPGMSFILYHWLDGADIDAVIQEQIAYFSENEQRFTWDVYDHDTPADLKDRLVAHGFEPDERDAVMVLDLEDAPASLLAPVTADVRSITNRDQLDDAITVLETVWGGDFSWVTDRLGSHLDVPGYLNIYVAYVGDERACVGWIYFSQNSQFAVLNAGSTVPDYRKRGLYTAILATRAQEAIRRGYRFLTVDAGPMSWPIVAKHGFELLTYGQSYERTGADA